MPEFLEIQANPYMISTDPSKLDVDAIASMLSRSYWARGRTRQNLERALQNSLVFGLYEGIQQIGLARVVTDYGVFGYLCDVFVHEDYRGRGLGKWLVQTVMSHPDLQGLRRWILATQDAHALYRQFGWSALEHPDLIMEILKPNPGEESA